MAWLAKFQPGNMMYVARDHDTVKELGKQRITPILKQIDPEVERDLDAKDQTVMVKRVNGATMRFVGGQSASGFITWPASYGFIDEAETHGDLPEGSTITLTRARFKADPDYKMIVFSKAQDEPVYEIDKITRKPRLISGQGTYCRDEYYSGTQEKCHVPCPRCGHYQELIWGQVKLDPAAIISGPGVLPVLHDPHKVLEMTYYECVSCHGKILDAEKRKFVPLCKYVPTPAKERLGPYPIAYPGRRSAHISDLYSWIFNGTTWGHLMLKWLEAQGDHSKMDAFLNDHMGLPRLPRQAVEKVELQALDRLINKDPAHKRLRCYDAGRRWRGPQQKLHFDPQIIIIGVDKQKSNLKFVIAAFDFNGEAHILDWGVPAEESDITYLLENFRVETKSGDIFGIDSGLIDCGHRRSAVIEYAYSIRGLVPGFFLPARGHGKVQSRGTIWPSQDESTPGELIQIVNFDNQFWEDSLYRDRIMEWDPAKPKPNHPRLYLPVDVDDEFREEMCNAQFVMERDKKGDIDYWRWKRADENAPNDYADCVKQSLVAYACRSVDAGEEDEEEEPTDPFNAAVSMQGDNPYPRRRQD